MKDMKQWSCRKGHILGFVRWDGNDVPQLMVLREALDMQVERLEEVGGKAASLGEIRRVPGLAA